MDDASYRLSKHSIFVKRPCLKIFALKKWRSSPKWNVKSQKLLCTCLMEYLQMSKIHTPTQEISRVFPIATSVFSRPYLCEAIVAYVWICGLYYCVPIKHMKKQASFHCNAIEQKTSFQESKLIAKRYWKRNKDPYCVILLHTDFI